MCAKLTLNHLLHVYVCNALCNSLFTNKRIMYIFKMSGS